MHTDRTRRTQVRRTVSARFVDRTTEDERVISVRVAAPATAEQLESYLRDAYPYPSYFRLDQEPTLPLSFAAVER